MRKYVFIILTVLLVCAAAKLSFGSTSITSKNVYYQTVDVTKGDTLWEIAERYKDEKTSTIEYITQIKDFNGMNNDKIKVGQKIIIPIYHEEIY